MDPHSPACGEDGQRMEAELLTERRFRDLGDSRSSSTVSSHFTPTAPKWIIIMRLGAGSRRAAHVSRDFWLYFKLLIVNFTFMNCCSPSPSSGSPTPHGSCFLVSKEVFDSYQVHTDSLVKFTINWYVDVCCVFSNHVMLRTKLLRQKTSLPINTRSCFIPRFFSFGLAFQ